jgi:hypothetical protein
VSDAPSLVPASLPAPAISVTTPPTDPVLATLREIKEGQTALGVELRADLRAVNDRVDSLAKSTQLAFDTANEAKMMAGEVRKSQADTVDAMKRHADAVSLAAKKIVEANDKQTPILETIEVTAKWAKQRATLLITCALLAGHMLGTCAEGAVKTFATAREEAKESKRAAPSAAEH